MVDPRSQIRRIVRSLEPYTVPGHPAPVKLNQNENPFDLPEDLKKAILDRFLTEPWNRYPDAHPVELTNAIAESLGVQAKQIIISNGSNELIYTIMMSTVEPGIKVLIPTPTFSLYEKTVRIFGGEVIEAPMHRDLSFDTEAILRSIEKENPALVVLVTPHSPTAQVLPPEALDKIIAASRGLVIIDEAYIDFTPHPSALKYLHTHRNVIVLRTFSKAFAFAGMRIGFLVTSTELREELMKTKLPFAVNRFSMLAAQEVLKHQDLVREHIQTIVAERERVFNALREMDHVEAHPSQTNFLIFRTQYPAQVIFNELLARGVLVRDVSSYPMLERMLRVTIGSSEENNRFLEALKSASSYLKT